VRALDAALASAPRDVELLLLRGMAEDVDPAGRGMGSSASAIPYFARALAVAPASAAAHHYLTHAYENAGRIDKALVHGARFAALAPRIPHAQHMYGHDLRRAGRIDDAIARFRAAYDLEMDPARVRDVPPEFDWHHQHNLDLLATSYQYLGQIAAAEPLLRRSFEIGSPFVIQEFNKREWPAFLLATGRAEEALAAARILIESTAPLVTAAGHIVAGRSLLALGRYSDAAAASNAAMKNLDRAGPEASLAAPDLKALQAEFFLRTKQRGQARAAVEDAVRRIRARPGPDNWSQGLFALESLARAAAEAGDSGVLEFVAAQMREHDADYGGTHYMLALAAEQKQDRAAARREFGAAKQAWARADKTFAPLAEINARLR
jgi:tetratricopeptide (TPR) repeat protein